MNPFIIHKDCFTQAAFLKYQ